MTWLRVGDTIANDPRFIDIDSSKCDINELFSFITRLFILCAQYSSSSPTYTISKNLAYSLIGFTDDKVDKLIEVAKAKGMIEWVKKIDGVETIKLVADNKFFHLYDDADSKNKEDRRNPKLTIPVRLRDGDNCRWCGIGISRWTRTKGGRMADRDGQLDHLYDISPNKETSANDLVVSCGKCNKEKGKPSAKRPAFAPERLLPEPKKPRFIKESVDWFQIENGLNLEFVNTEIDEVYMLETASKKAYSKTKVEDKAAAASPPAKVEGEAVKVLTPDVLLGADDASARQDQSRRKRRRRGRKRLETP